MKRNHRRILVWALLGAFLAGGAGIGAQGGSTTIPAFKRPIPNNPVVLVIPVP